MGFGWDEWLDENDWLFVVSVELRGGSFSCFELVEVAARELVASTVECHVEYLWGECGGGEVWTWEMTHRMLADWERTDGFTSEVVWGLFPELPYRLVQALAVCALGVLEFSPDFRVELESRFEVEWASREVVVR